MKFIDLSVLLKIIKRIKINALENLQLKDLAKNNTTIQQNNETKDKKQKLMNGKQRKKRIHNKSKVLFYKTKTKQ